MGVMKNKNAFTLAEVLITLGIIGVVAAMTIPTLIANTNSAKFRSQFKKTLSTLNQAGLMAQAQYDINYAATNAKCGDTLTSGNAAEKQNPNSDLTFCAILNGTLTGQRYVGAPTAANLGVSDYSVTTATATTSFLFQPVFAEDEPPGETHYTIDLDPEGGSGSSGGGSSSGGSSESSSSEGSSENNSGKFTFSDATNYVAYTLADGSMIAFNKDAKDCELALGNVVDTDWIKAHSQCVGFIDVNGATLPNKEVNCSSGATTLSPETPCTVKADANHMTDIYPVVFHDATVEPASNAAKYVLSTAK